MAQTPLPGTKVGEWVDPSALTQAFHALRQTHPLVIARVRDRMGRMMRHVFAELPFSILSLAKRMARLSLRGRFMAVTGCTDLLSSHPPSTGTAPVALSAITAKADRELHTAAWVTT